MLRNRLMTVLGLLVVASMLLAACGQTTPAPTEEAPASSSAAPAESSSAAPEPTAEPTAVPVTRKGPWVDEVTFIEQGDQTAAVTMIQAGEMDVYADGITDPKLFKTVQADTNLAYSTSFGLNFEFTYNPVQNFTDGRLNPFGNAKVREATNLLLDRNYIIQEIFGGLGTPKYLPIVGAFPDYARYPDVARKLEAKYAYNPEAAAATISTEMEAMGATKGADGKWMFNDQPVTIILIIRTEDERTAIGDYFAGQLESIGFTVDRQYKSRSEASPIWNRSDPAEGQWNAYTGGWINTVIARDDGTNFGFYYTNLGSGSPLWQAYQPTEEFYAVSEKLWNNQFATMEERGQLFQTAMELAMQDSVRVWVIDTLSFFPQKANISVAADLAGGVSGSRLWPYTLRIGDTEGGSVKIGQQDNLVDPWNPIAGSNWISDQMPGRATSDVASMPDPYTGLYWPQRAEKLEVVAAEGLPITKTLDWVDLKFENDIAVPVDAWADWDATAQKFITVGEKFPEGATSQVKVTWTYPADMFSTVTWHDGSPLTVGDFVMGMILNFDTAKAESAIYDEAQAPLLDAFLATFKGVKIVSTDPLVIETYTDSYQLDAEAFGFSWWPNYGYGPGAWHNLTPAIMAEGAGELAFSTDKAGALSVEWTSFVAGPSLEVQKKYLDQAQTENYIPYAETLGQFVTADEAKARYANLEAWYGAKGHFWIGTGPMYLDQVFPVEGNLVLKRYEAYPDLANKWDRFSAPHVAEAEVDGAGQVTIGSEATFDVFVTYAGEPYASAEIDAVKFLVFNAKGELVSTGTAEFTAEGQYTIVLSADVTKGLEAGANKLEAIVVSKVVSIPTFATFEFVTAP